MEPVGYGLKILNVMRSFLLILTAKRQHSDSFHRISGSIPEEVDELEREILTGARFARLKYSGGWVR
jgi:hypothetical protein